MLITNAVRKQWTRVDFERMVRGEIFAPDERVELIEGEIIAVSPPGPEHSYAIIRGNTQLVRLYGRTHDVSVQNPLDLGLLSQPQPDFALVLHEDVRFDAHPCRADLVIEVAWSSMALDRNEKAAVYACAGIPEYWIVDLLHGQVEVLRDPGPSLDRVGAFEYRTRQVYSSASSLQPLLVPGSEFPFSSFFPADS